MINWIKGLWCAIVGHQDEEVFARLGDEYARRGEGRLMYECRRCHWKWLYIWHNNKLFFWEFR